jgi:hypothetical protein
VRVKELGLPLLQLGDHVVYTHRASAVLGGHTLKDIGRREGKDVWPRLGYPNKQRGVGYDPEFKTRQLPNPARLHYGGKAEPLHRWVAAWPEDGTGMVVGLTYRYEGWRREGGMASHSGGLMEPDYEGPSFDQCAKLPLYEVRLALATAVVLVPPWACVPLLPGWNFAAEFDDRYRPPAYCWQPGGEHISWAEYVQHWLGRSVRARAAGLAGAR